MDAWLALLVVSALVAVLALWLVRLARRRHAQRADLGAFLRRCEREGTPPEVAALVFHALQGWMGDARGEFAVHADDRLESVYGIGAGERAETAALLLRRCGRRAEPDRPHLPLETAADLARYVASCPRDPGTHAGAGSA